MTPLKVNMKKKNPRIVEIMKTMVVVRFLLSSSLVFDERQGNFKAVANPIGILEKKKKEIKKEFKNENL